MIEERHRREVEPTLSMLREALLTEPASAEERYARERMAAMHELIDQATRLASSSFAACPPSGSRQLLRLGRATYGACSSSPSAPAFCSRPETDEERGHVLA
ncbi:MAG: hypothetical protein RML12_10695 [Xanthomonadales bacterium]|nr:hypothetical protein [Xanthomonadales bacterium]